VPFVPAITHSKPLKGIRRSTLYPDAGGDRKGIIDFFKIVII
jgi:hypothetical protein